MARAAGDESSPPSPGTAALMGATAASDISTLSDFQRKEEARAAAAAPAAARAGDPPPEAQRQAAAPRADTAPQILGEELKPAGMLTAVVLDAEGLDAAALARDRAMAPTLGSAATQLRAELVLPGGVLDSTTARRQRASPAWHDELELRLSHSAARMQVRVLSGVDVVAAGCVNVSVQPGWIDETVPLSPCGSLRLRYRAEDGQQCRMRENSERALRGPPSGPRWLCPAVFRAEGPAAAVAEAGGAKVVMELYRRGQWSPQAEAALDASGAGKFSPPAVEWGERREERVRLLLRNAAGDLCGCAVIDADSVREVPVGRVALGPRPGPQRAADCEELYKGARDLGWLHAQVSALDSAAWEALCGPRETPQQAASPSSSAPAQALSQASTAESGLVLQYEVTGVAGLACAPHASVVVALAAGATGDQVLAESAPGEAVSQGDGSGLAAAAVRLAGEASAGTPLSFTVTAPRTGTSFGRCAVPLAEAGWRNHRLRLTEAGSTAAGSAAVIARYRVVSAEDLRQERQRRELAAEQPAVLCVVVDSVDAPLLRRGTTDGGVDRSCIVVEFSAHSGSALVAAEPGREPQPDSNGVVTEPAAVRAKEPVRWESGSCVELQLAKRLSTLRARVWELRANRRSLAGEAAIDVADDEAGRALTLPLQHAEGIPPRLREAWAAAGQQWGQISLRLCTMPADAVAVARTAAAHRRAQVLQKPRTAVFTVESAKRLLPPHPSERSCSACVELRRVSLNAHGGAGQSRVPGLSPRSPTGDAESAVVAVSDTVPNDLAPVWRFTSPEVTLEHAETEFQLRVVHVGLTGRRQVLGQHRFSVVVTDDAPFDRKEEAALKPEGWVDPAAGVFAKALPPPASPSIGLVTFGYSVRGPPHSGRVREICGPGPKGQDAGAARRQVWLRLCIEYAEGLPPANYAVAGMTNAFASVRQLGGADVAEASGGSLAAPAGGVHVLRGGEREAEPPYPMHPTEGSVNSTLLTTHVAQGYGGAVWGQSADFDGDPTGALSLRLVVIDRCAADGGGAYQQRQYEDQVLGCADLYADLHPDAGDPSGRAVVELRPRSGERGEEDRARQQWFGSLGRVGLSWRVMQADPAVLTVVPRWQLPHQVPVGFAAKLCLSGDPDPPAWLLDPPEGRDSSIARAEEPNKVLVTDTKPSPVELADCCRGGEPRLRVSVWDGRGGLLYTGELRVDPRGSAGERLAALHSEDTHRHAGFTGSGGDLSPARSLRTERTPTEQAESLVCIRWRWQRPPSAEQEVHTVVEQLSSCSAFGRAAELPLLSFAPLGAAPDAAPCPAAAPVSSRPPSRAAAGSSRPPSECASASGAPSARRPAPEARVAGCRLICAYRGTGFSVGARLVRPGGELLAEEGCFEAALPGGSPAQSPDASPQRAQQRWAGELRPPPDGRLLAAARPGDVLQVFAKQRGASALGATVELCAALLEVQQPRGAPPPSRHHCAVVEVGGARELCPAGSGAPSFHCELSAGAAVDRVTCSTRVAHSSISPQWGERFHFVVPDEIAKVEIRVMQRRDGMEPLCVGRCDLGGQGEQRGAGWFPLRQATKPGFDIDYLDSADPCPRLWLRWRFAPSAAPDAAAVRQVLADFAGQMRAAQDTTSADWTVCAVAQVPVKEDFHKVHSGCAVHLPARKRVLIIGGMDSVGEYERFVGAWDYSARRWGVGAEATGGGGGGGRRCCRRGHSAVLYEGNRVIVFGGYGPGGLGKSFASLRAGAPALLQPPAEGDRPQAWVGPVTAPAAPATGGARRSPRPRPAHGEAEEGYHNTVLEYNTDTGDWCELETRGSAQDHRAGHTALLYGHKMLVWGGIQVLVRETGVLDSPSAEPAGADALVLCGTNGTRSAYSLQPRRRNDLAALDLRTMRWKHVRQDGIPPRGRTGHTAVKGRQAMYVYGGEADRLPTDDAAEAHSPAADRPESGSSDDDLLDTRRRQTSQAAASPRGASSARNLGTATTVFLGDMHAFDLAHRSWLPVAARGDIPVARCGHSATSTGRDSGMLIFGGTNGGGRPLACCYWFSFDPPEEGSDCQISVSGLWRRVQYRGCARPLPRSWHCAVAVQPRRGSHGGGGAEQPPGSPASAQDSQPQRTARHRRALTETQDGASSARGGAVSVRTATGAVDANAPTMQLLLFGGEEPLQSRRKADGEGRHSGGAVRWALAGTTTLSLTGALDAIVAGSAQHVGRMKDRRDREKRERRRRERGERGGASKRRVERFRGCERTEAAITKTVERLTRRNKWQAEISARTSADDMLRHTALAKPLGCSSAVTATGYPGKLTARQQDTITDRLYYQPLRTSRHRRALREAQDGQHTEGQPRRTLSQDRIEEVNDQLYYKPLQTSEEKAKALVVATDKRGRQLTQAQEEKLCDRLFYRDGEHRYRDRQRVLEHKHIGPPAKPLVRTREEWRETVTRLYGNKNSARPGSAGQERPEEVTWGGAAGP
eukprot:TRINITY_DN3774_c0_g2_i1.p1 TRINITY_DN3774_c0_g2~~TRINITY_DN3774_c0_g2_i1.p1  ORF type:complete len:2452 (+),score=490.34 TRINITY_DN3774_c0_g2_i1:91-7446(+)